MITAITILDLRRWVILKKPKRLTLKQQRFIDEYIISGSAAKAAAKAGYSKRTAKEIGMQNLGKPYIREEMRRRLEKMRSKKIMDMQEVMEHLTSLARGDAVEELVTNTGNVVRVKTKNGDRLRALEMIGKRYGAWTEKKEVSGTLEINVGVGEYDEDD